MLTDDLSAYVANGESSMHGVKCTRDENESKSHLPLHFPNQLTNHQLTSQFTLGNTMTNGVQIEGLFCVFGSVTIHDYYDSEVNI